MRRENLKDKIESMFRCDDSNMAKLAQKICHAERINYYVYKWTLNRHVQNRHVQKTLKVCTYSLYRRDSISKFYKINLGEWTTYEIKLSKLKPKNNGIIKAK